MGIIQYAILNDIHWPYHDKIAYDKALKMMQKWPDLRGIYLNGDICEIESVSSHPKSPRAQQSLLDELDYANKKFDQLEEIFGDIPIDYLAGNHENRIYRYLRDVAPHLWGMLEAPKLFRFDERKNFRFHDYGPSQLVKVGQTADFYCRHEPLVGGAFHAKGSAEKSLVSLIYGHTHVHQQYTHKKFGPIPKNVTAVSNGWLGDISKACFDYRGSKDNWQLGFSRIDCDERDGSYEIRFISL